MKNGLMKKKWKKMKRTTKNRIYLKGISLFFFQGVYYVS